VTRIAIGPPRARKPPASIAARHAAAARSSRCRRWRADRRRRRQIVGIAGQRAPLGIAPGPDLGSNETVDVGHRAARILPRRWLAIDPFFHGARPGLRFGRRCSRRPTPSGCFVRGQSLRGHVERHCAPCGQHALTEELIFEPPERAVCRIDLRRFIGEIHDLLPADVDLVVIAQEVLGDRLAVDQRTVGAAEILEEGVGQDCHDRGMLATDGRIGQADIVVGAAPDRDPLALEADVERGAVSEIENELAHAGS